MIGALSCEEKYIKYRFHMNYCLCNKKCNMSEIMLIRSFPHRPQFDVPVAVLHSVTLWFVNWDKEARIAVERMDKLNEAPATDIAAEETDTHPKASSMSASEAGKVSNDSLVGAKEDRLTVGMEAGVRELGLETICEEMAGNPSRCLLQDPEEDPKRGLDDKLMGAEEETYANKHCQGDGISPTVSLTEVTVHPAFNDTQEGAPLLLCIDADAKRT